MHKRASDPFDSLEAEADAYEEQMVANGYLKPIDRWWRTSPSRVERRGSSSGPGRQVPREDSPQNGRRDEYVSLARAAEITGLSEKVLRRAINDGELPAVKLRRRIRIQRSDLDAWIEAGRIQP